MNWFHVVLERPCKCNLISAGGSRFSKRNSVSFQPRNCKAFGCLWFTNADRTVANESPQIDNDINLPGCIDGLVDLSILRNATWIGQHIHLYGFVLIVRKQKTPALFGTARAICTDDTTENELGIFAQRFPSKRLFRKLHERGSETWWRNYLEGRLSQKSILIDLLLQRYTVDVKHRRLPGVCHEAPVHVISKLVLCSRLQDEFPDHANCFCVYSFLFPVELHVQTA